MAPPVVALLAGCGSPPDIVLVTVSALRRDHVGAYGWKLPGPPPTPHLDSLAEGARVFEGATTTASTPVSAHTSLFTGLAPAEHGVTRTGERVAAPIAAEHSLPAQLAAAGYRVGAFVTSNAFGEGLGLGGFDPWDAPKVRRTGVDAVEDALAWLDRAARSEDRPIFLWVHLHDVHAPYGAAAEKAAQLPLDPKRYGFVDRSVYRTKQARIAMTARYAAGVREADAAIGLLRAGLVEREREPLFLVSADHGEFMAEQLDRLGFAYGHGRLLGPEVLWIPLLIAGPDVAPARVAGAVSITDLYTTILAAAGVEDPRAAGGVRIDLREDPPPGRIVVAEGRRIDAEDRRRWSAGAAALRAIDARALAVSDGATLLLVSADGRPADPKAPAPPELLAAATAAIGARLAPATVGAPPKRAP